MMNVLRQWAVLVSERLGWLTVVDKRIVSRYLAYRKSASSYSTSGKNKGDTSGYRWRATESMPSMPRRPHVARVLAALLVSMTIGAVVLMYLGKPPPSGGPFLLAKTLTPIEEALDSDAAQIPEHWNRIDVSYTGTRAGNIEQLASLKGLVAPDDLNCHFVICNGTGGADGEIQATFKWKRQWSVLPSEAWHGTAQTVSIWVVADLDTKPATHLQMRRVTDMIEELCRRFKIPSESVSYPKEKGIREAGE